MCLCIIGYILNKLGKNVRYEASPSIMLVFPNQFNHSVMQEEQDSIYHMTL